MSSPRLLLQDDLKERGIRYTASSLRRLEQLGLFPQRVKLSRNRVGWMEDEIDSYIAGLAGRRDSARA